MSGSKFHDYCLEGNLKMIRRMVQSNEGLINKCSVQQDPPLFVAVSNKQTEVVSYLLSKGADATWQRDDGATALHVAAQQGYNEILQSLAEANANMNAVFISSGATPLHLAAERGHRTTVEYLLGYRANPNLRKKDGASPLFLAAQEGHLDVVKLLIDNGADATIRCHTGGTALHVASENSHRDVVEYLLDLNHDVDLTQDDGTTALYIASQEGDCDIVKVLLDKGAKQCKSSLGISPLQVSWWQGHNDVYKTILNRINLSNRNSKQRIDVINEDGLVSMTISCGKKNTQVKKSTDAKSTSINSATSAALCAAAISSIRPSNGTPQPKNNDNNINNSTASNCKVTFTLTSKGLILNNSTSTKNNNSNNNNNPITEMRDDNKSQEIVKDNINETNVETGEGLEEEPAAQDENCELECEHCDCGVNDAGSEHSAAICTQCVTLTATIEQLHEQLKEYKEQLDSARTKNKKDIAQQQEKTKKLKIHNEQLEAQLAKVRKSLAQFESKTNADLQLTAELEKEKARNQKEREELKALQSQRAEWKRQRESFEQQCQKLQKEKTQLDQSSKKATNQISTLEKTINKLNKEKQQLEQQISNLQQDKETLQRERDHLQKEKDTLVKDKLDKTTQIQNISKELDIIKNELEANKKNMKKQNSALEKETKEKKSILSTLDAMKLERNSSILFPSGLTNCTFEELRQLQSKVDNYRDNLLEALDKLRPATEHPCVPFDSYFGGSGHSSEGNEIDMDSILRSLGAFASAPAPNYVNQY